MRSMMAPTEGADGLPPPSELELLLEEPQAASRRPINEIDRVLFIWFPLRRAVRAAPDADQGAAGREERLVDGDDQREDVVVDEVIHRRASARRRLELVDQRRG